MAKAWILVSGWGEKEAHGYRMHEYIIAQIF
jgi:hypothetical protein